MVRPHEDCLHPPSQLAGLSPFHGRPAEPLPVLLDAGEGRKIRAYRNVETRGGDGLLHSIAHSPSPTPSARNKVIRGWVGYRISPRPPSKPSATESIPRLRRLTAGVLFLRVPIPIAVACVNAAYQLRMASGPSSVDERESAAGGWIRVVGSLTGPWYWSISSPSGWTIGLPGLCLSSPWSPISNYRVERGAGVSTSTPSCFGKGVRDLCRLFLPLDDRH